MRRRGSDRLAIAALVAASALLAAPTARAQEQAATAEALFREGRELVAKGKYDEACPKFAASEKLDPGYGTLYNLGECLVHVGKTASAWAAFNEAIGLAKAAGQTERVAKASRAAEALEPKLERMVVSVKAPVPGLVVRRGGVAIDAAAWGSALPIDPGKHHVEASAPGKKPFAIDVASGGPGKTVTVEIPALEDAPPELHAVDPVAPPPPVAPADTGKGRRIAGIVTGSLGVVGLAVGAGMAAVAKSKWSTAQTQDCPTSTMCNATGVSLVSSAKSAATASTIGFAAGGVLAATGVVLIVTALPPKATNTGRLVVAPVLDPKQGGVVLQGSF